MYKTSKKLATCSELNQWMGGRVRHYRKQGSTTQRELTDLIGMGSSGVSFVERGERGLRIYEVYQLCDLFGVSVAEFLELTPEPAAEPSAPTETPAQKRRRLVAERLKRDIQKKREELAALERSAPE